MPPPHSSGVGERVPVCEDGISCPFAPHTFRRPNGQPSCGPKGEGLGRPADGGIYIQLGAPSEAELLALASGASAMRGLGGWICLGEEERTHARTQGSIKSPGSSSYPHTATPVDLPNPVSVTQTYAHRDPQRTPDLHRIHTWLHPWTSQTQSHSHTGALRHSLLAQPLPHPHTAQSHRFIRLYRIFHKHAQRSIYTATQSQSVTQSRSRVHV